MTRKIELSEEERLLCRTIKDAIVTARPRKTISVLAEEMGLTYNQINNVMNERTKPSLEMISKLREVLKLPKSWPAITPITAVERRDQKLFFRFEHDEMAPIPIAGKAAAGDGEHNVDVEEDRLWVPKRLANLSGVGWIIEGDSMMPKLSPGDIAIFREYRTPRKGYPFLIRKPSGELRIKIIDWDSDGWIVRSLNKAYQPEPLGSHEIIGYMIGWYKSKGTRETLDSDPTGLILTEDD